MKLQWAEERADVMRSIESMTYSCDDFVSPLVSGAGKSLPLRRATPQHSLRSFRENKTKSCQNIAHAAQCSCAVPHVKWFVLFSMHYQAWKGFWSHDNLLMSFRAFHLRPSCVWWLVLVAQRFWHHQTHSRLERLPSIFDTPGTC